MNCIVCGCNNVRKIKGVRSSCDKATYNLMRCKKCNSHFFDIQDSAYNQEELYGKRKYKAKPERKTKTQIENSARNWESSYWKNEIKLIKKIARRRVKRVLDVGCFSGDYLMNWGDNVIKYGVELDERAIGIAEKRGIHVIRENIDEMKPDTQYDVVTAYALLEHLRNPGNFIRKLGKMVEKGGAVVILVPTRECLKTRILDFLSIKWYMDLPPEHITFISKKYMDALMEQEGFILIKRKYTSGGILNPFAKFLPLSELFMVMVQRLDKSMLNRLPIFDHMYSYYIKR